jgi:hypothetical protein
VLGAATGTPPYAASLLIAALDFASWGILAAAGASPLEAIAVLRELWTIEDGGVASW